MDMKARLLRKAGTNSCAGSLTTSSCTQRLKDGSTPFLSKYKATRERFAPWNMQINVIRSGGRTCQTPTHHLKIGGEMRMPMSRSRRLVPAHQSSLDDPDS